VAKSSGDSAGGAARAVSRGCARARAGEKEGGRERRSARSHSPVGAQGSSGYKDYGPWLSQGHYARRRGVPDQSPRPPPPPPPPPPSAAALSIVDRRHHRRRRHHVYVHHGRVRERRGCQDRGIDGHRRDLRQHHGERPSGWRSPAQEGHTCGQGNPRQGWVSHPFFLRVPFARCHRRVPRCRYETSRNLADTDSTEECPNDPRLYGYRNRSYRGMMLPSDTAERSERRTLLCCCSFVRAGRDRKSGNDSTCIDIGPPIESPMLLSIVVSPRRTSHDQWPKDGCTYTYTCCRMLFQVSTDRMPRYPSFQFFPTEYSTFSGNFIFYCGNILRILYVAIKIHREYPLIWSSINDDTLKRTSRRDIDKFMRLLSCLRINNSYGYSSPECCTSTLRLINNEKRFVRFRRVQWNHVWCRIINISEERTRFMSS